MKKYIALSLAMLMLFVCCACNSGNIGSSGPNDVSNTPQSSTNTSTGTEQSNSGSSEKPDLPSGTPEPSNTITLADSQTDVGSTGATFKDGIVSITKPGVYTLKGSLTNGGIKVSVDKTEQVELILAGATIRNPEGPAIFCDSADKLFITVAEGTQNTLRDDKNYKDPDGPNATVYCDDDLTVRGTGSLKVIALHKNAISSKNDIKIKDLKLTIEAYNTAIRGKFSVTITNANIEINCGNDGIKATELEREDKGFVSIESGTLKITAGDDAIQAETHITILEGTKITANAVGKKTNAPVENVPDGVFK